MSGLSGLLLSVEFCLRSVGLSVDKNRVLWENGSLDQDVVWDDGSDRSKEPYIRWRSRSPSGKKNKFFGIILQRYTRENAACGRRGLLLPDCCVSNLVRTFTQRL